MNEGYKIAILLSSYNGEQYIEEQIKSIMNQVDCGVTLVIRDDGSKDRTVDVVKRLQENYSDHIILYRGENLGYRRSFMELLLLAPDAEFYGFADQDDYWLEEKCKVGIESIITSFGKDSISLYASAVSICDENLEIIGKNDINSPNCIESLFVRHRIGGCTMIFTRRLKNIAKALYQAGIENRYIDHDFMLASVAYSYGNVIRDNESHILHRRSEKSVTSGGRGVINRLKMELLIIFERKDCQYDMALQLRKFASDEGTEYGKLNTEDFVDQLCGYKESIGKKMKLLKNKKLTSGVLVCDMEAKLKIVMKNF
jgi:glycosyltransferase involved in cell wall biosynthesis